MCEPLFGPPTPVVLPPPPRGVLGMRRHAEEDETEQPILLTFTVQFPESRVQDRVVLSISQSDSIVHVIFSYEGGRDDVSLSMVFFDPEDVMGIAMDTLRYFDGLVRWCDERSIGLVDYAHRYRTAPKGESYDEYVALSVCEEIIRGAVASPRFMLRDEMIYRWAGSGPPRPPSRSPPPSPVRSPPIEPESDLD